MNDQLGPIVQFKEDMTEAKERMAAWWDGESLGRPAFAYHYQKPAVTKIPTCDEWHLAKNHDDIEGYVQSFEAMAECFVWGGEHVPRININYGPGIMAALFGCTPKFYKRTVWFEHPTPLAEIEDLLEGAKLDNNNEWFQRILRVTEAAAAASKGRYAVNVTDIGGVLDILSSFLGAKELIVAMFRQPAILDTCRRIILEKWHQLYDAITAILDRYALGCTAWMNVWCPKHWYPIQCDFSAMLSPKWFRRFVLPDLKTQCDQLDYCIYHWDGPHQLPYCDDILGIPNLTGIQWVPGTGQPPPGDDKWMPLYKKAQLAGKHIVADPPVTLLPKFYNALEPKGVFISSMLGSEILAEFYLPEALGGMGGIDPDE